MGVKLALFEKAAGEPFQFQVRRLVNAGYVGRDSDAVKSHIEELKKMGIPPPRSVPLLLPVSSDNITTGTEIEVVSSKTSGEAEFVLLLEGRSIYVGVGSDHTDRELEKSSILLSKQVCPNVISSEVWDYEEVKSRWDSLVLRSWVGERGSEEVLYQRAPLGTILSGDDLMSLVKSKLTDADPEGLVIYSGTIPVLTEEIIFGDYFRSELFDEFSGRTLRCAYAVTELNYLAT